MKRQKPLEDVIRESLLEEELGDVRLALDRVITIVRFYDITPEERAEAKAICKRVQTKLPDKLMWRSA